MTRHGRGRPSKESQKKKTHDWVKRPEGYKKTIEKIKQKTGTLNILFSY
jgi:hypothetical protein